METPRSFLDVTERSVLILLSTAIPFIGVVVANVGLGIQVSYASGLILFAVGVLRRRKMAMSSAEWGLVAFLAIVALSYVMGFAAPQHSVGGEHVFIKGLKQTGTLTLMAVVYVGLRGVLQDPFQARRAVWGLTLGVFASSIYAVYQVVGFYFDWPLRHIPLNNVSFRLSDWDYLRNGVPRAQAFAPEPSMLAGVLIAAIPLLLSLTVTAHDKLLKRMLVLVVGVATMALALTFTRGSILTLIAVGPLCWTLGVWSRRGVLKSLGIVLTVAGIGIALAFQVLPPAMSKVTNRSPRMLASLNRPFHASSATSALKTEDTRTALQVVDANKSRNEEMEYLSTTSRMTSMIVALNQFRMYPLLGVGFGNYGFFYDEAFPRWGWREAPDSYPVAQSLLLGIAAETGVLGVAAYLWFVGGAVLNAFRLSFSGVARGEDQTLLLGTAVSLVATLANLSITAYSFAFMHLWFLSALLVATSQRVRAGAVSSSSPSTALVWPESKVTV